MSTVTQLHTVQLISEGEMQYTSTQESADKAARHIAMQINIAHEAYEIPEGIELVIANLQELVDWASSMEMQTVHRTQVTYN